MAFNISKTDHLFVPFNRFGFALRDSKCNTRVYKDLNTLKRYNKKLPDGLPVWDSLSGKCYTDYAEYAPVIHGRWVHDHYENCTEQFEIVKCSNCGYTAYAIAVFVKGGNYCPNCGVKMDGKEECE